MFTTKTTTDLLKMRLDAEHYSPVAIANEKTLRAFGVSTLAEMIDVNESGYGSLPDSADYCRPEEGIPLIRGGDLSFGSITPPEAYVPSKYHVKKCAVQPGDVLLLIKGACIDGPEGVGLVPSTLGDAIFNGSCFRARCNRVDPGFLVAYSLTQNFLIQKAREIANTGISYNSEESIHGFIIPRVGSQVQKYIGDKVRHAEMLRQRSRQLSQEMFNSIFIQEIAEAINTNDGITNRVQPKTFNADRFDPKYYSNKSLALVAAITRFGGVRISDLCASMTNGFESRDFQVNGTPYLTVSEISSGRINVASAPRISAEIEVPMKAKANRNCVLVVRGGSVGIAAKVFEWDEGAAISSDLIRLEFASEEVASATAAFLGSDCGAYLMKRASYGAVMPKLGQEELASIIVPSIVLEKGVQLNKLMKQMELCARLSSNLMNAAKRFVEAIVERRITEDEIAGVQYQLEQCNESGDRAILSRLFEGGLDAKETRPLFPDLDAYYETLRIVEREQAEVPAK